MFSSSLPILKWIFDRTWCFDPSLSPKRKCLRILNFIFNSSPSLTLTPTGEGEKDTSASAQAAFSRLFSAPLVDSADAVHSFRICGIWLLFTDILFGKKKKSECSRRLQERFIQIYFFSFSLARISPVILWWKWWLWYARFSAPPNFHGPLARRRRRAQRLNDQ